MLPELAQTPTQGGYAHYFPVQRAGGCRRLYRKQERLYRELGMQYCKQERLYSELGMPYS
jgi:hypothetical protein